MNKQVAIMITEIANGYIVVGTDETVGGAFGPPSETRTLFVPSIKELCAILPEVLQESLSLVIDADFHAKAAQRSFRFSDS